MILRMFEYNSSINWRFTYTYDSIGNLTTDLYEQRDGSQLVTNRLSEYYYDLDGNKTLELIRTWDENQWVNKEKYTITYDPIGNKIPYSLVRMGWK